MSMKSELAMTNSILAETQLRLIAAQAAAPSRELQEAIDYVVELAGIRLQQSSQAHAAVLPRDGAVGVLSESERVAHGLNAALQMEALESSLPRRRAHRVVEAVALPLDKMEAKAALLRTEMDWLRSLEPAAAGMAPAAIAPMIEEGRYRLAAFDQLSATWCDEAWPESSNAEALAELRTAGGYGKAVQDEGQALWFQDLLDHALNARLIDVAQSLLGPKSFNELRGVAGDGIGFRFPSGEAGHLRVEAKCVGAGRNVIGLTYHVSVGERSRVDGEWTSPLVFSVPDRMATTADDMGLYLRHEAAANWARMVQGQRLVKDADAAVRGTMDVVTGWMPSSDDRYAEGFAQALSLFTKELAQRGVAPEVLTDALAYTGRAESAAQRVREAEEEAAAAPHP